MAWKNPTCFAPRLFHYSSLLYIVLFTIQEAHCELTNSWVSKPHAWNPPLQVLATANYVPLWIEERKFVTSTIFSLTA